MHAFLKGGTLPKDKSAASKSGISETGKKKREQPKPWVEKYRPVTVDDVAYQDEVVAVLKKAITGNDLPNLLFYGPPGTGKTSTILAASRQLFGPELFRQRVLELNASDERGISVVRDKIKTFANLTASAITKDGKPCPSFKIIILDEADSMTSAAQAALRRTMEKQSKTTRFCIICNYVSRIIEPITSRCAKFRFKPLAVNVLEQRLNDICEKENISFEKDALAALITTSEGDMRKAITTLQSTARLKVAGEAITQHDVYEIAGVIPDEVIQDLIKVCHSDSYEKLEAAVKNIMLEGHSATQVINQLHDQIIPNQEIGDRQKSVICERLSMVDHKLMDGADEYLQIMDLCTVLMQEICHGNK